MDAKELTPEQKAKFKECETPEEVLSLAQSEGVELTLDQLDSVSGGWGGCTLDTGYYG